MFPSGSFEMYFAMSPSVRSQCTESVKFKMNQNDVTEMMPSGTFGMSPSFQPPSTNFGKFQGNFGNTANTSQGNRSIGNILNVFAVCRRLSPPTRSHRFVKVSHKPMSIWESFWRKGTFYSKGLPSSVSFAPNLSTLFSSYFGADGNTGANAHPLARGLTLHDSGCSSHTTPRGRHTVRRPICRGFGGRAAGRVTQGTAPIPIIDLSSDKESSAGRFLTHLSKSNHN
jgi:hypothetical protein